MKFFSEKKQEQNNESTLFEYEGSADGDLFTTIKEMIKISKNKKVDVFCDFNGTKIEVKNGSNFDFRDIVDAYYAEIGKRRAEYKKNSSKEYQLGKEERRKHFEAKQTETNKLINELPNIDWNNTETVLDWLDKFNYNAFGDGVGFYQEEVLEIFSDHGYHQNFADKEYLDTENKDRYAKYIIGLVLENANSYYNPVVGNMRIDIDVAIKNWKNKFGTNK
jgi:hypothetical protein